jgi:hypothetical protein
MKRVLAGAVLMALVASPVFADVAITAAASGKGLGMSLNTKMMTYIKGHKMRIEVVNGQKVTATIIDLDAQQMISLNVSKKEAEVTDMAQTSAAVQQNLGDAPLKVKFAANGEKKEIAGRNCVGYDMSIAIPMSMGQEKKKPGDKESQLAREQPADDQMTVTLVMAGPVWIAKDAPGTSDYAGYYRAAIEKGFVSAAGKGPACAGEGLRGDVSLHDRGWRRPVRAGDLRQVRGWRHDGWHDEQDGRVEHLEHGHRGLNQQPLRRTVRRPDRLQDEEEVAVGQTLRITRPSVVRFHLGRVLEARLALIVCC